MRKLLFFLALLMTSGMGQIEEELTRNSQIKKSRQLRLAQINESLLTFQASPNYNVDVIKKYKRDMLFFVEGLTFISKNTLLESTGLQNQTEIHLLNLDDMSITNSYTFESDIFGEGSVMIRDPTSGDNVVFMMTYQNRIVYKMDQQLTHVIAKYNLPKGMIEGWGMTKFDDQTILATDGSNKLFYINPADFTIIQTVEVIDQDGHKIDQLNEVEVINGVVFVNIFLKRNIYMVKPDTGEVIDKLDFTPLVNSLESEQGYAGYTKGINLDNCLNGIAYNQETGQYLITGKNWPYIYEIKLTKIQ